MATKSPPEARTMRQNIRIPIQISIGSKAVVTIELVNWFCHTEGGDEGNVDDLINDEEEDEPEKSDDDDNSDDDDEIGGKKRSYGKISCVIW